MKNNNDQICDCIISVEAICSGHSSKKGQKDTLNQATIVGDLCSSTKVPVRLTWHLAEALVKESTSS